MTGAQPYQLKRESPSALEEAILDAEPPVPSKVAACPRFRKKIRGDLDTIILHALKKKPEERYGTAQAFAADVERFLEGLLILARPDSRRYRVSKFIGRHKLALSASAAALLVVLAGAGAAVWEARVATAERQKAEAVKEFLVSTFQETDPYAGSGRVLSAIELVMQARRKIDGSLGNRPDLKIELLNVLGWSLLSLQDMADAEKVINEAVAEAAVKLGSEHPQTLRARVLRTIVYRFRGRNEEMRTELDRLLPALWRNREAAPQDLIRALRNNASLSMHEGKYVAAESTANQALELSLSTYGEKNAETATSLMVLGLAHIYGKQPRRALSAAERALHLTLELDQGNPRHPRVIEARDLYGRALTKAGQAGHALEQLTRLSTCVALLWAVHADGRLHLESSGAVPVGSWRDRDKRWRTA